MIAHFLYKLIIGLAKKFVWFFFLCTMALVTLTSFKTILLDCIVTDVISACIKKTYQNWWILCRYFNIEDGRKYTSFSAYIFYYFKKGKYATEMQKKICAVYGESAVYREGVLNVSKVVREILWWRFLVGRCSMFE